MREKGLAKGWRIIHIRCFRDRIQMMALRFSLLSSDRKVFSPYTQYGFLTVRGMRHLEDPKFECLV